MIFNDIITAVTLLREGKIVAIPTETVYGLAADSTNEIAIRKVFELKERPLSNPLILHCNNLRTAFGNAQNIPLSAYQLAEAFWPGPLTMVLPKAEHVSDLITASQPSVALRVPQHGLTLQLLNYFPNGLVAPSANKFTFTSTTSAQDVANEFESVNLNVLDGGICKNGIESTIITFSNNQPIILRYGAVSVEEIEQVTGIKVLTKVVTNTIVPGMHNRHYAPKTKLIASEDVSELFHEFENQRIAYIGTDEIISKRAAVAFVYQKDDLKTLAANLYRLFHKFDSEEIDVIIVERPVSKGIGTTINDRLNRASVRL